MKSKTFRSQKLLTFAGLFTLIIPLIIFGLWQYAFNSGGNQAERVTIFHSYLPDLLCEKGIITYISIVFCILTIILSSISLRIPGMLWKVLNYTILVFSILLLLLNLFSIM